MVGVSWGCLRVRSTPPHFASAPQGGRKAIRGMGERRLGGEEMEKLKEN